MRIKVEFTDRTKKTFPCDTYHPNYCDCLRISKKGLEDVNIPLCNVRTWTKVEDK